MRTLWSKGRGLKLDGSSNAKSGSKFWPQLTSLPMRARTQGHLVAIHVGDIRYPLNEKGKHMTHVGLARGRTPFVHQPRNAAPPACPLPPAIAPKIVDGTEPVEPPQESFPIFDYEFELPALEPVFESLEPQFTFGDVLPLTDGFEPFNPVERTGFDLDLFTWS